jgi:hypothetical protein
MLLCSGLLLAGSATAFAGIPARRTISRGAASDRMRRASPVGYYCAVVAPPLEPRAR